MSPSLVLFYGGRMLRWALAKSGLGVRRILRQIACGLVALIVGSMSCSPSRPVEKSVRVARFGRDCRVSRESPYREGFVPEVKSVFDALDTQCGIYYNRVVKLTGHLHQEEAKLRRFIALRPKQPAPEKGLFGNSPYSDYSFDETLISVLGQTKKGTFWFTFDARSHDFDAKMQSLLKAVLATPSLDVAEVVQGLDLTQQPDLTLGVYRAPAGNPNVDPACNVTLVIRNTGGGPAFIEPDAPLITEEENPDYIPRTLSSFGGVNMIVPGAQIFLGVGPSRLRRTFRVDPNDVVAESNETNNVATVFVPVCTTARR